jgi:hypothetical protein
MFLEVRNDESMVTVTYTCMILLGFPVGNVLPAAVIPIGAYLYKYSTAASTQSSGQSKDSTAVGLEQMYRKGS